MLDAYSEDEIEVVLAHELVASRAPRPVARHGAAGGDDLRRVLRRRGAAGRVAPWLELRGPPTSPARRVLLLVAGVFSFVMLPLGNALSRAQERRADRFALRLTRNPAAFVTAMRRLSQQNLAEERPSRLARWLFYSHPPMRERIAAAQAWADVAPPLHAHAILPAKE